MWLKCLNRNFLTKTGNKFFDQILEIWHKLNTINEPHSCAQILNESIWCNQNISYELNHKAHHLFLKNWISAGINTIGDIWNFENKEWKSKDELNQKIHMCTDYQYHKVISSVEKYRNVILDSNIDTLNYQPKIKTHIGFLLLEKATSKKVYNILISANKDKPVHESKLNEIFNCQLDWRSIYLMASYISKNAYLLQTHFKLTHNILPSNQKLYQWKRITSPDCICGDIDNNFHYIVGCKNIKPFWDQLLKQIVILTKVNFPISDIERYFGIKNTLNVDAINSINYILLVARTFIWTMKRHKKTCFIIDFILYLKETLLIENATKTSKIKGFLKDLFDDL